jgi:hypothetical protein
MRGFYFSTVDGRKQSASRSSRFNSVEKAAAKCCLGDWVDASDAMASRKNLPLVGIEPQQTFKKGKIVPSLIKYNTIKTNPLLN